jgi:hypothetical protein
MPIVYRIILRATGDAMLAVSPSANNYLDFGGGIAFKRLYSTRQIAKFTTMEEAIECKRVLCEMYGDHDGGNNPFELQDR